MTPDELRSLADKATPGPWEARGGEGAGVWAHGFRRLERGSYGLNADLSLAALAPDLARLCAEFAGVFSQIEKLHHKDFDLAPQIAIRALAKLSDLKPVT